MLEKVSLESLVMSSYSSLNDFRLLLLLLIAANNTDELDDFIFVNLLIFLIFYGTLKPLQIEHLL